MKLHLLVLILLLTPLVQAELLDSRRAELNFRIDGSVDVLSKGGYTEVNFVEAKLNWYPEDSLHQDVLNLEYIPALNDDGVFYWKKPDIGNLHFRLDSDILTSSDYVEVKSIVPFPLSDLPEEYVEYTYEQEIIDLSDDIRSTASSLASGKNDLFEVLVTLAEYSRNNIEYDLSSVTVSASQKSSWVLENRRGVCDELTSLFISMARSLGIPARFVSGVSYTNIDTFDTPWQAHGWAEVYFPDIGWVPFDVTYGEYAWLDSSHIKLKDSLDADRTAAEFKSQGKNYQLKSNDLIIDADIIESVGRPIPSAEISIEPAWNGVSFGSYNVVKVKVTNLHDYYVSDSINFAKVPGMTIFLPESNVFMLKPYETKEFRYLLKVTEDLDSRNRYSFPLQINTGRQIEEGSSFRVEESGTYIDKETAESLLDLKTVTGGFGDVLCKPEREFIYLNQTINIICSTGESDVELCYENECKFGSSNFEFSAQKIGFKTLEIKMYRFNEHIGSSFLNIEVLDDASLQILEIGSSDVEYGGVVPLKFKFRNSVPITELNITLEHELFDATHTFSELSPNVHDLTVNVNTANLLPGHNRVAYHVSFVDKYDTVTTQEEFAEFQLLNSPWHHRLWGWIVRNIGKLF